MVLAPGLTPPYSPSLLGLGAGCEDDGRRLWASAELGRRTAPRPNATARQSAGVRATICPTQDGISPGCRQLTGCRLDRSGTWGRSRRRTGIFEPLRPGRASPRSPPSPLARPLHRRDRAHLRRGLDARTANLAPHRASPARARSRALRGASLCWVAMSRETSWQSGARMLPASLSRATEATRTRGRGRSAIARLKVSAPWGLWGPVNDDPRSLGHGLEATG